MNDADPPDSTSGTPGAGATDNMIDALVRAGRYEEAAAAAAAGDRRRAIALYERVWRFAEAVPLALAEGDAPLATRLAIDAGDPPRARAITARIPGDARGDLDAVAGLFAARGLFDDAALVRERVGDFVGAAANHQRAGNWMAAGNALAAAGLPREAIAAYETAITDAGFFSTRADSATTNDDPRESPADNVARALTALGKLQLRLRRPREAAARLQQAMRNPSVRADVAPALAAALLALGHETAARVVARRARHADPALADDPRALAAAFLDHERAAERFRILRLLGTGATGRVYLAEDRLMGREVALKILAVGATPSEHEAVARFAREAEAIGRLRHPRIVALHDIDRAQSTLVLEAMFGGTLADAIAHAGALPLGAVRRLGLELCDALGAAHHAGVVHRDVKPANVFFDGTGGAKLGDFGAAHLADFGQTQTGGFIGTLAYLSPEQIRGDRVGPAADLYALGVTLFEALTGRLPFPGPDFVAQHLGETSPAPSALMPGLASAHDQVLLRALAKDPRDRHADADAFARDLRAWPAPEGPALARKAQASESPRANEAPIEHQPAPHETIVLVRALGRTDGGTLFEARDTVMDRFVLVDERDAPLDDDALLRLRRAAAVTDPRAQRVLALAPSRARVVYEHIPGELVPVADATPNERACVAAALAAIAASAGATPTSPWLVRGVGGIVAWTAPLTEALTNARKLG